MTDRPAVPQRVTALDDARVRDYVGLRDVELRRRREAADGLYIAEGEAVVRRALAAGHRPRSLLTTDAYADAAMTIAPEGVPVLVAAPEVMAAVAGFDVHRGFLASMHRPAPVSVDDVVRDARRVLLLEDLVDATNVGALFRSAAALGFDAVIVSNRCADPLYRRAVKVSMGAVFQIPWARAHDWTACRRSCRDAGLKVVVLSPRDSTTTLDELAPRPVPRMALLVGAESAGVRARTREDADEVVAIPMAHGVDSLNVATAGAVAMWALRSRGDADATP